MSCNTDIRTELTKAAQAHGATASASFDPREIELRSEVRDMCAADRCGRYGKNWMCPPGVASLDYWNRELERYDAGILLQVTVWLEDPFDYETMLAGEKRLKSVFRKLKKDFPPNGGELLFLQAGSCDVCETCTFPDLPCRFPELALPSLEAIGIVVTDLCRSAGLPYYYGDGSLTYSGAILVRQPVDKKVQK